MTEENLMGSRVLDLDKEIIPLAGNIVFIPKTRTIKSGNNEADNHMPKTMAEYKSSAADPTAIKFISDIMRGNKDRILDLQLILGYGLRAYNEIRRIFICPGTGANGKSTLFEAISRVLGSHICQPVSEDTLNSIINTVPENKNFKLLKLKTARMCYVTSNSLNKKIYEKFLRDDSLPILYILCNIKPRYLDMDIRKQIVYFPFTAVFKDIIDDPMTESLRDP